MENMHRSVMKVCHELGIKNTTSTPGGLTKENQ